ncbi:DUF1800 family protein [Glaciecola siphonariae]|uniref:DUF1800 family protein n=1 Tax=Glaciecola siphonariae TaxID=521012 RepID=A0ABV9LXC9_9ALTE
MTIHTANRLFTHSGGSNLLKAFVHVFLLISVSVTISACSGGSDNASEQVPATPVAPAPTPAPAPAPPPTPEQLWEQRVEAARLLSQTTFGPTLKDIESVVELGQEQWLNAQLAMPATSHLETLKQLESTLVDDEEIWRLHRMEAWWQSALYGEDQLRQRVAFALSQLMVISERSNFFDEHEAIVNYYDLLAKNAFGNYRVLLEEVTLSPLMGMYLSMLGNEKADEDKNIRPDENFAREVMQLFSIGLVELNLDASAKLDENNQPIATYDQTSIENYAKVFTGWHFNGTSEQSWYKYWENYNTLAPMTAVETRHDKSEKTLLNGVIVPANQSAEQDLKMALDSLFNHPNLAPFVAKHLIMRLVTSNPTPEYIARVASVFNDNGAGVRGDLSAVVKALIMDAEAREGHMTMPERFGKIKEPILKGTHLWRAFLASHVDGRIKQAWPEYYFNQAPLAAPSVFNFYLPDYTAAGELADANMRSPELQIVTETFAVRQTNFMAYFGLWSYINKPDGVDADAIVLDFSPQAALVDDPDALIDELNLLLMSGRMSENYQAILKEALIEGGGRNDSERIANLVFLITASPQFALQH